MKKIYLILSIIILSSFFQVDYFTPLTSSTEIEKTSENAFPSNDYHQQSNGIQILTPQNGEVITGSINIQWAFFFPYNLAEVILSDVYYSPDSGVNWIQLAFAIRNNTLEWNTALYEKYGTNFKIRITATSKDWEEDLEAISEEVFVIDNRVNSNFPWYWYIVIFLGIISIGSMSGLATYRIKMKKQPIFDFGKNDQTNEIKKLSQKVVIGLDNIKDKYVPEISTTSEETISLGNGSVTRYFSDSFHNEFKSEIKGRTVMVLIEIAYQNPTDTNPVKIAEGVDIPLSTLSKEIKKLISLNYIESHVTNQVLLDARYRNFKITAKGFEFLNMLNIILKNTINQIQNRNQYNTSQEVSG